MKKLICLVFSVLFLSACSLIPASQQISPTPSPRVKNTTFVPTAALTSSPSQQSTKAVSNPVVAIKTENGQIIVSLFADKAPNTVKNFLAKANNGFYNGLTFHRVIADFMAQGGDPAGTGTGGGTQKSEFTSVPFVRGSLGLARTPDTKEFSNDSQFFICFTTSGCQHLTGDYVNFGQVISGFDVLDKISQGDRMIEITTRTK